MRFTLHGGSDEEMEALRGFAERLGADFVAYGALEGNEPVLVVQCLPRKLGLLESLELVTRWMDGGPPPKMAAGAQDALPGLETPPCR